MHLVDDLHPANTGARRLDQFCFAGRQRRIAAQCDLCDVPLSRPYERLRFGNQAALVIDEPHAWHCFDRTDRAATAVFRKCIRGEGNVAPRDIDPGFVEHGTFKHRAGAGGQIGFQWSGACPNSHCPKDGQWNQARPPFAAPLEKSVHSTSRGACCPLFPKLVNYRGIP